MARIWLAAIVAVGAGRIAFYYLVYEPISGRRGELVGSEFEPLRAFLDVSRVAYLSDEPVDADPSLPRRFDKGDMMYARAQYALAPVILTHTDQPLALANFADARKLEALIAAGRYQVVARPAPTIALLRRR